MRCPNCHRRLTPSATCPVDAGQALQTAPALADPPPRVAGFEVLSLLGRGGFADVFTAARAFDGLKMALKVGRDAGTERFDREAEALRRIGPPVVPQLFESGVSEERKPFLALELLAPPSLAGWMAGLPGSGAANLELAVPRFEAIAQAVDHLHRGGLVHRDLKPENVFFRGPTQAALIDLGLARFRGEPGPSAESAIHITQTGQRLGTAHYMAPEQCLDAREVDWRADLYSLGVILFELLTGRPPFVGDFADILQAHASLRPPRPSALGSVSPGLDEVVLRCLAKEPSARFGSIQELLKAIRLDARSSTSVPSVPKPSSPAAPLPTAERSVALLGVRTSATIDQLLRVVETEGGTLARIHPGLYLFSFHSKPSVDGGLRAAGRAARLMAKALPELAAVVHVAKLRARARSGVERVMGLALEHPEQWWPANASGAIATSEAIALLEPGSSRGEEHSVPLDAALAAPEIRQLFGRDRLLASIEEEVLLAWHQSLPSLTSVIGEAGHGKSALLTRLAENLARSHGSGEVICVTTSTGGERGSITHAAQGGERGSITHAAQGGERGSITHAAQGGEADATLRALLRESLGLTAAAPSFAAVRNACVERLEMPFADAASPAVAQALGVAVESRVQDSPGDTRYVLAKAIAEALKSRARRAPLALILDDAHRADPVSLDAIEIASLGEAKVPLWIGVAALPTLTELRPYWGDRAGASQRHELPALGHEDARALLRALLHPVEFVPEPLLQHLEAMTQGVPMSMVELVHGLRLDGAIRRQPGGSEWHLAGDELLRGSATALHQRLAQRALKSLSPALRSLAFLCAGFGDELEVSEVDSAQQALDPSGVDPAIGLERLARAGLLRTIGPGRYRFRQLQFREAVEAEMPAEERHRLHAALLSALELSANRNASLLQIARHAEAVGARDKASSAHLTLAEQARVHYCYVDADRHYTTALSQMGEADEHPRFLALAGRGKARYRLHRFYEALEDLRAARKLAEAADRTSSVVELLLEEATVLDWVEDWAGAQVSVERALPLAKAVSDEQLLLRCDLGRGRSYNRQGEFALAARLLSRVVDRAEAVGDGETRAIGLVLLAFALAYVDLDQSESRFAEAIALCKSTGDGLHLGSAYCNRVSLWMKRHSREKILEDLRLAVALARELGFAQLERFASYNLAECLHWLGNSEQALPIARRARDLGMRFFRQHPIPLDALLLARICAKLKDYEEAQRQLDWIDENCPHETFTDGTRTLFRSVELAIAPDVDKEVWARVVEQGRKHCSDDELVELLTTAAEGAARAGRADEATQWMDQARGMRATISLPSV